MHVKINFLISILFVSECAFLNLFSDEAEFVVPFLSEFADERVTQELIDWQLETLAEFDGTVADIPTMIGKGTHAIAEGADTDRVEGT